MRFPARHFDTVTIDQVLYFASNPDALIKEATRVLKPHGRLLLVAFTEAVQAKTPPSVGIAISDIQHWLEEAGLEITATNVLPGDVLDISLLVSEKTRSPMNAPRVSFEFFPPKTPEAEASLWKTVERLAPLNPEFVSITYGADGSTRERTHQVIESLLTKTNLKPVPHLTCVGAPQEEIASIADEYWSMGVRQIVALRGDPEGDAEIQAAPITLFSHFDGQVRIQFWILRIHSRR